MSARRLRVFAALCLTLLLGLPAAGFDIPRVESVWPAQAGAQGGTTIRVSGSHFEAVYRRPNVGLGCKFGAEVVSAWFLHAEVAECRAPAHAQGFVRVELTVNNETAAGLSTAEGASVQYCATAAAAAVQPSAGVAGTLLAVQGTNFLPGASCRFGALQVPSAVESSTLVRCETPAALTPGAVALDVVNAGDLSSRASDSALEFFFMGSPSLRHLSPRSGPECGGTRVEVHATAVAPVHDLRCRFGTTAVSAAGGAPGDALFTCASPAQEARMLARPFQLALGGTTQSIVSALSFTHVPALRAVAAVPDVATGSTCGAFLLHFDVALSVAASCWFSSGQLMVPAFVLGSAARCTVPPISTGFVTVKLLAHGPEASSSIQMLVSPLASVTFVSPVAGPPWGGGVLTLTGMHFRPELACRFGAFAATPTLAGWVSSALLLCEQPALPPGAFSVDTVHDAAAGCEPAGPLPRAEFLCEEPAGAAQLQPNAGDTDGGTAVVLLGALWADSAALECSFGSISPVHGARISSSECRCASPAHAEGFVPVQLNRDAPQLPAAALSYQYAAAAQLFSAAFVLDALLILGAGFPLSTSVRCRVCDAPLVSGVVRDAGTVVCDTPAWFGEGQCVEVVLWSGELLARSPAEVGFAFAARAPDVVRAFPADGSAHGGTAVALYGGNFGRGSRCGFGDAQSVRGVLVSTALLWCESPIHSPGPADVAASSDDGAWSQSVATFVFKTPLVLNTEQPSRGPTSGGTVVHAEMDGRSGEDAVFCTFGAVTFVRAAWLSSASVSCSAVAHAPGDVVFTLSLFGGCSVTSHDSSLSVFSYYDPPAFAVLGPAAVLVPAASIVSLDWEPAVPGGVACSTGQRFAVPGRVTPASTFCEVSPGTAGFFVVDLTFEDSSGAAQFQLLATQQPRAAEVFPDRSVAAGGTLLALQGSSLLLDDLACLYDGVVSSPAVRVSSVLVVCETLEQQTTGLVTLHLVSGLSHRVDNAVTFRVLPAVGVAAVVPSVATAAGGTTLRISTEAAADNVQSCRLGTFFPVAAFTDMSGVRCIAPAHVTAVTMVALSLNGQDLEAGWSLVQYVPQPVIIDINPTAALVDGDAEVSLSVDLLAHTISLRCAFDDASSALVQPLGNTVLCHVPAHAAGFAAVQLHIDGDTGQAAGISFLFRKPAAVLQLLPSSGPSDGATVLHMLGVDLVEADAVCAFSLVEGVTRLRARFESSALVRCETLPSMAGEYIVDADALAAPARGGADRPVLRYKYTQQAFLLAAEPQMGDTNGGTVVAVACTGQQTHCRFGSIGPVLGTTLGEGQVACATPARPAQAVWLSTTANLVAWASSAVAFQYLQAPGAPAPFWPDRGFSSGGDSVWTWLEDADSQLNWRCIFGSVAARARVSTACAAQLVMFEQVAQQPWPAVGACYGTLLACISPALVVGVVPVTLASEAGEFAAADFTYAAPPVVSALLPSLGPITGGGAVLVLGVNFSPTGKFLCVFGLELASVGGAFVSSAVLRCEVPPHAAGITTVSVFGASSEALSYVFYELAPAALTPAAGPEAGGTAVEVGGSGFTDSMLLSCRFGTTFPVSASWMSSHALRCISPALYPNATAGAQYPRPVPVYVSSNLVDVAAVALSFEYQPSVRVAAATPRSGLHLGQTPVFVMGSGFVNTTALACRFGLTTVPAMFLSYATVLCIAPAQAAGPVFLEVTNNGEDYTTDRLIFHYGTCRGGHYCPSGEPLPCPRGAYCAGTANFNFTVCPPGTYQPQVAQAGCLPSPVGYIAPDFGTVYPRPCPRGAVCDVMGLSGPAMPCPPGHFCLDGTRTANFTDFRVAERPLPCPFGFFCVPGVGSNQSIANNFTTPQLCHAGYLCEPGSVTPQGSGPCPSGHYCPPGQLVPCPPRTYCPNVANTEPKPCLPGTYNQDYGRATCKQCPPGTVCPGFARDLPEPCPPGYVCDQVGLPLPTARCPAGHFCLANTVTADPLAPLDEQQLLDASPIALNASNFRPHPCFPATYCLEGVGNSTTAEGVYFNPQPCNAGSYCEWATSDRTVQGTAGTTDISNPKLPCPTGSYCPTGTYIPIPAPRGSFASGTGNAQAALCLPGTYTHYEGFERCLACPAGYECRKDGTYKPAICDAGKYRSSRDSITCVTCPVGTWSPYKGLTDEALCLPCNAGLVCGVDGMKNSKPYGDAVQKVLNGQLAACERSASDPGCTTVTLQPLGQSSLCPEGYVCDARTSIAADKCPDGYFCGYGTTPETQFANPCPAGYFCPAGTTASGRFQFPCLACFYCPAGTGIILPRCPEGTQSAGNAQLLSDCTADQITFWRVQPLNAALINRTAELASGVGGSANNSTPGGAVVAADAAANATNTSTSASSLESVYAAFGRCTPTNFDGLLPTFLLDGDTLEQVVDIEGTPLVYFSVPRNYVAKMQFDFRNISAALVYGEHYEVMIFTGDYTMQTACSADEYQRVPCPPWNMGDGINKATMGEYADRQFETKCPRGTNALEMPFWFARNGLYGAPVEDNNLASPATGTFVDKKGLLELNLLANDDLQFRVEVRMLHGLYQEGARRSFLDTMCIDLLGPERGSSQANASFHIVLPRNDGYQLPLNIPRREVVQRSVPAGYDSCSQLSLVPTCRYLRPEVTLAFNSSFSSEFMLADRYWRRQQAAGNVSAPTSYSDYLMTVPDVVALEGDMLLDASQYWASGDPFLAMEYLPFFSACRGFDANVLLYQVLQTGWTDVNVEGMYRVAYGDGCQLVPAADTKFINQWAPQIFTPVADVCSLEFTCLYQESYASAAAVPRWFESAGDTLFYVTKEPQSRERLFEASMVATDQSTPPKDTSFFSQALSADGLMGVEFRPASGSADPGSVPKVVTFDLTYFPYSPSDKRLISAGVMLDGYQPASTHDGTYTLAITLTPLGWFDLLNAFAFDTLFYSALFFAIGMLADGLLYAFWGFCRLFTRLRDPPRFHGWALLSLLVEPQVVGLMLAMMPFYLAELGIQQLFQRFAFIATFPANVDNLGISLADEETVNGRIGLCFLVVSLHGLYCTSVVLIPDRATSDTDGLLDADGDDEDGEAGKAPVRWQRTHFISGAILMAVPDLFLSEFSVGNTYGLYLYPCWFMMKMYHLGAQALMIRYVLDELLFGAITGINETMETIITIAAGTFTEFALAYYLDVMYACIEDLFLEEAIDTITAQVPRLVFELEKLYYRVRKRTITEQLLHAAAEDEDSQVESLMGFICGYGPATTGLVTVPFLLFFVWDFNAQLQYTSLWSVTRPDLLLYVLFVTVMIPFQWFMDMFRFNAQEVFQGWKVYEYLKYARYRFRNRTARWKGLETQFDESIEPSLRASDQMCFSNQWYFTLGLGSSSGTLFVLALQIILRANYNMFADILFFVVAGVALLGCVLGRKAALALADAVNLWKIRDAPGRAEGLFGDEEEPLGVRRDGGITLRDDPDRRGRPVAPGDLTSADLTSDAFRRQFLDANKLWLIDQLGERLTPRSSRRLRTRALSSDDDSDAQSADTQAPPVNLSETSAFVMRQWAANARMRAPGRLGRTLPVLSTDDEDDDVRFAPVALTQTAASVLAGWLAASRSTKVTAPAAGILSSTSGSDTSTPRARFQDVHLSAPTLLVGAAWLQRARRQRQRAAVGVPELDAVPESDSASELLSSDSSDGAADAPAALTARARAVALTWLSIMRIRRAVHTV